MSTAPSARPPSSQRRTPDLDSDHARQFVERAASHPSVDVAEPRQQGRGGVPVAEPAPPAPPPRRDPLRPLTLRIPEALHNALLFIADNSSKSMNQFAIDALTPAAEAQIAKIMKRKELGLD
jgi:hypothetical protein